MRAWIGTSILGMALLAPPAAAHFPDNMIYVVNGSFDTVVQVNPSDWSFVAIYGPVDGLNGASSLAFNEEGNMLIANGTDDHVLEQYSFGNGRVAIDDLDGLQTSVEKTVAVDGFGWVYVGSANGEILKMRGDFLVSMPFADSSDGIVNPTGMDFDLVGNMLVANQGSGGQVLMIDTAGNVSVFDTIPGEDAMDVQHRDNGDIYVSCMNGNLYRYPGGVAANRVLFGTYGGDARIRFNIDQTSLIHLSRTTGELSTIEPDTGVGTVQLVGGWDARAITIAGAQMPAGSYTAYGHLGTPGLGNWNPEIHGEGNPRPGGTVRIDLHDFAGGIQAFLVTGIAPSAIPFVQGVLSVDITQWWDLRPLFLPGNPGGVAEGNLETLTFGVPNDPILVTTKWYFQAFGYDSAAAGGVSMTHGTRMQIGQ